MRRGGEREVAHSNAMPSARDCVIHIRATLDENIRVANSSDGGGVDALTEALDRVRNVRFQRLSAMCIHDHAAREYAGYMKPAADVLHDSNFDRALVQWITALSDAELETCLSKTPGEVPPEDAFTPWQRLSMYVWMYAPFDVRASIEVPTAVMHSYAYGIRDQGNKRQLALRSAWSRKGGTMPDVSVVDLCTASWKTAWSLSVAFMRLCGDRFDALIAEESQKARGRLAPEASTAARVVVVAAAPSTLKHFEHTLSRLIPTFRTLDPACTVDVLSATSSAAASLDVIRRKDPAVVTFWFVPIGMLNTILRRSPDVAVPVCICDEFTVDTPRARFLTMTSPIFKLLITQGTPSALCKIRGAKSLVQDVFGGPLLMPYRLATLIRFRSWTEAQRACQHYCMLKNMTLGPLLRCAVYHDLGDILPESIELHAVRSRRQTFSSHIRQASVDLFPASLGDVLLHFLIPFRLDVESANALRRLAAQDAQIMSREDLRSLIAGLTSNDARSHADCRARLLTRIDEFAECCPVCLVAPEESGARVFSCCGYCVCQRCFDGVLSNTARCPFCRRGIMRATTPPEVTDPALLEPYPIAPTFGNDDSLQTMLDQVCGPQFGQFRNGVYALQAVRCAGFVRPVVIIERDPLAQANLTLSHVFDPNQLSSATGFFFREVDTLLTGRGTQFAHAKRYFDDPANPPCGFLSLGGDTRLLTGTNLDYSDCLVVIGSVPSDLITQMLGRLNRPRRSRDNTKPIALVYVLA